MAWDDFLEFEPRDQYDLEHILFDEDSQYYDEVAHDLWMAGVANDDSEAYADLIEYLDYWYDIDFEAEWDWEIYGAS